MTIYLSGSGRRKKRRRKKKRRRRRKSNITTVVWPRVRSVHLRNTCLTLTHTRQAAEHFNTLYNATQRQNATQVSLVDKAEMNDVNGTGIVCVL